MEEILANNRALDRCPTLPLRADALLLQRVEYRLRIHDFGRGLRRPMDQPPAAVLGPPASLDHRIEAGSVAECDHAPLALGRIDRDVGPLPFLVVCFSGESLE